MNKLVVKKGRLKKEKEIVKRYLYLMDIYESFFLK